MFILKMGTITRNKYYIVGDPKRDLNLGSFIGRIRPVLPETIQFMIAPIIISGICSVNVAYTRIPEYIFPIIVPTVVTIILIPKYLIVPIII